jgi:hypothetical protein
LHFPQRERGDDGQIIANRSDYEQVHSLLAKPLSEGLEAAVPHNVREVVDAVRVLLDEVSETMYGELPPDLPEIGISQRQIAEHLGREKSVVSRNVNTAIELGYLVDLAPGQGRESKLRIGPAALPTGSALPSPAGLFHDAKSHSQGEGPYQMTKHSSEIAEIGDKEALFGTGSHP